MKEEELSKFYRERKKSQDEIIKDESLQKKSLDFMIHSHKYKYSYNFSWMGRPIIKYPADMLVQQELIWSLKPDLIIETGIAHGGSLIYFASLMTMMGLKSDVLGIDIDIRDYNRKLIEEHPMSKHITMFEGSSINKDIVSNVKKYASGKKKILIILDSLHTHEHVLKELEIYSDLVSINSYLIVADTSIEFFPKGYFSKDRPWDRGNNPYTAMKEFISKNKNFVIDKELSGKALITETIDGYLKKTG